MPVTRDTAKSALADCFLKSTFLAISRVPVDVSLVEAIAWREYNGSHVCLVRWGDNITRAIAIQPHTFNLLISNCWLYCADLPDEPMMYRTDKRGWSVHLPGLCQAHLKPIKLNNLPVSTSLRVIAWATDNKGRLSVMMDGFPTPIIASDALVSIIQSFNADMISSAARGSLVITTASAVKTRTIAPGKRGLTLDLVNATHEKRTQTLDSALESVVTTNKNRSIFCVVK